MEQSIQELIQAASNYLQSHANSSKSIWETIFNSPGFTTLIGVALGMVSTVISSKLLSSQNYKERLRAKYEAQLNEFYNPLIFLLEQTTAIYKLFNIEEKKKDPKVKTLNLLLDGHNFSKEDTNFLEKIINNNNEISKLISKHSGLIDEELLESLVMLTEHYDLIECAYNGDLTPREEYRQHTYPAEITAKIKNERNKIQKKLSKIR